MGTITFTIEPPFQKDEPDRVNIPNASFDYYSQARPGKTKKDLKTSFPEIYYLLDILT